MSGLLLELVEDEVISEDVVVGNDVVIDVALDELEGRAVSLGGVSLPEEAV